MPACTQLQLPSLISFGHYGWIPKIKNLGLLISPDAPQQTNFLMEPQYLQMPTSILNSKFVDTLFSEIWRGLKIKSGAADLPRPPQRTKFLHEAIVPAIAYQYTKFQLASSISSGDMEGLLKYKLGAAVPHTPPSGHILYRALVVENAYKCATFQHRISISYGDMEGVPKEKKWQLLISPDAPSGHFFYMKLQYLQLPTGVRNFNFLARLVPEIWRDSLKYKLGAGVYPARTVADNIQRSSTRKCLQVCQI